MDDEQKKWHEQFSENFGAREYVRFSCLFVLWMFLPAGLALVFNNSGIIAVFLITAFLVVAFTFSIISRTWKPAYAVLRKILGNKNLPVEPMPRSTMKIPRQPRPWWSYLPGLWFFMLTLLLFYLAIKYFSK
jgi:uncharacterized membrane protein HdeD (DUF308 family)